MKRITYALIILVSIQININAQTGFAFPDSIKRILFLGNSITYSGQYVSYIEAYLTIRYSEKTLEFINAGLPSETVSGLSEPNHAEGSFPRPDLHDRLDRILISVRPDLVFACYGINDGIYMDFDDDRFQKFRDGMNRLYDKVTTSGSSIIFITPPIFDERKGKSYSNVVDLYSDWLLSCQYTKKWDVIDIHWPMRKYLENKRVSDSNFYLAKDGVHPTDLGHWIMAKQILLFLGEKNVASAENAISAVSVISNGELVLKLIENRQQIMKDAWLNSIGHKRPGMTVGLQLNKAQIEAEKIEKQIQALLKEEK